jgi:hypothetical protein
VSPQLRTFRGGCEYRIWIVATTGHEIRTGCHHALRFGVISGGFGFWRITTPFYNAFLGVGQQNLAIPAQFALLTSSLRIRQEKRKMRTSKRSKPEILDNAPALCGVRKGNPDKVQVKRRHL